MLSMIGFLPVFNFFFGFFSGFSVFFLYFSDEIFTLSCDPIPIIVCQISPFFPELSFNLFPISFNLIPVHFAHSNIDLVLKIYSHFIVGRSS